MKRTFFFLSLMVIAASNMYGDTMSMVINEWNCVSDSSYLKTGSDTTFGRVVGNGDNWIELAVVQDHLDVRGWSILWDNKDPKSGSISFADAAIWSDLRQGTIIGIHQNDDDNDATGGIGVIPSDTSYDPFAGDWNILASVDDPSLIVNPPDSTWSVDNSDWRATLLDKTGATVQGYVGEKAANTSYTTSDTLGADEVGALINNPTARPLSYKDKSSASSFLFPNAGQDFTALRSAVVPEPGTLALLLCGMCAAFGIAVSRGGRVSK